MYPFPLFIFYVYYLGTNIIHKNAKQTSYMRYKVTSVNTFCHFLAKMRPLLDHRSKKVSKLLSLFRQFLAFFAMMSEILIKASLGEVN